MQTSIIEKRKTSLFTDDMIRNYLRLSTAEDASLLAHLLEVATDWVEDQLNKTFLTQTRRVSHRNTRFALPYGPVQRVKEVRLKGKRLTEEGYTLTPTLTGESLVITLPFQWKSPEISVIYEAGYGEKKEDVPAVFQHAVLEILTLLYEHRGNISVLQDYVAPWLQTHKLYHLG